MPVVINWIPIKADYLNDPTMTHDKLAQKYGVHPTTIHDKSAKDGWKAERDKRLAEIERRAMEKRQNQAVKELVEVQDRHTNLSRMLQAEGVEAIQTRKIKPRSFRDAREAIIEGVNLERKIFNLDKPQIIGTMNQQNNFVFGNPDDLAKSMQTEEAEVVEEKQEEPIAENNQNAAQG